MNIIYVFLGLVASMVATWGVMAAIQLRNGRGIRAKAIRAFAKAVQHGDVRHRAWLLEAAECFIEGRELPKP